MKTLVPNPKSENRSPKEIRHSRPESILGRRTDSAFSFRASFGFRNSIFGILALLLSVFSFQRSGFAQSYAINWHTIDGGGGTSTGEVYAVRGTLGQPDARTMPMTGGQYAFTGGFWVPGAVQVPGAPWLTIELLDPKTVRVSWPGSVTGFVLQECAELGTGYWVNVSTAVQVVNGRNQVVITPLAQQRFYRLAPDEPPRLRIALTDIQTVLVAWPYAFANALLRENTALAPAGWQEVSAEPVQVGGEWQVTLPLSEANRFYRLDKP